MMFGTCLPIKLSIVNNNNHSETSNNNNITTLDPKDWTCAVFKTSFLDLVNGEVIIDGENKLPFQIVSLEEINTPEFCLKVCKNTHSK